MELLRGLPMSRVGNGLPRDYLKQGLSKAYIGGYTRIT